MSRCPSCGDLRVFRGGRYRCLACGRRYMESYRAKKEKKVLRAAWFKTAAGKLALRRQWRRHADAHPDRARARRKASHLVQKGRLMREGCSVCGMARAEMHHPDYSKPEAVVWLCRPCHRKEHGQLQNHV